MSAPNYLQHVEAAAARYPDAWRHAHTNGPRTEEFIRLLAAELHALDPRVGLNGKRGNANDISDDVLCYKSPGQSIDVRTGERVTVIDVIAGAGGPNPSPSWGEVFDPKVIPTHATWVQPEAVDAPVEPPQPPPVTPPAAQCQFTPSEILAQLQVMLRGHIFLTEQFGAQRNDTLQMHNQLANIHQELMQARDEIKDVRAALRNGLGIEAHGEATTVLGRIRGSVQGVAKG